MPDTPQKKFTEDEVGRLLQLAIKRQEDAKEIQPALDHGLTLEEVERIAQEVGIDPRHLRYALAHLHDQPAKVSRFHFWGTPSTLDTEIQVQGQLTEDVMVDVLAAIRGDFPKRRGVFEKLKHSFSWTNGTVTIEGQPVGEKTLLTFKEKMESPIIGAHIWWMISLVIGVLMTGNNQTLFIFSVMLGITSLLYAMAWLINRSLRQKKEKKINRLLSRLQEILTEHNQPVVWSYADPAASTAPPPKLDLDVSEGYHAGTKNRDTGKKTKSS